ncbi:MAG: methyltransferase domain-containing protein, partial [Betaproteobacteria bacterium]
MDWLRWNRRRYDAYAPLYDWVVGRLGFLERGRRRALEMAQLRAGERVLIVAAGTGLDLPLLPPGVNVVAIDISPAMLERCTARAAAHAMRIQPALMDAARLGF